jgi:hypothetical protein
LAHHLFRFFAAVMTVSRESAVGALFTRLQAATFDSSIVGGSTWGQTTRRLAGPETIAAPGAPGLALLVHHEKNDSRPPSPRKLTLTALAVVYVSVGDAINTVPDQIFNAIEDAIDAALAPDSPGTGRCTLAGAVYAAYPFGEIIRAPGDKAGEGLSLIPIEIVIP